MRNIRDTKGFTLIELMIVVVIIGILAAIAIPRFTAVSEGARRAEAEPILRQMCSLAEAERLRAVDGQWPADLDDIRGWDDPDASYFTGWTFAGGATGTASATSTADLGDPSMNCETREVDWS